MTGRESGCGSMKKAKKHSAPAKAKAPAKKSGQQGDLFSDMFKNLDQDLLKMLASGQEMFGSDDPVDLFSEFLETCNQRTLNQDDKNELLADLFEVLSELKIDSNGGDPDAREKIEAVYDLLDDAIERHSLQAPDLMMVGKILSDAGWAIPDSLKNAVAEALQAPPPDMEGGAETDLLSSLLEVADQAGQNPFDLYEYMNSFLACFPTEASVMLLTELIAEKTPSSIKRLSGFYYILMLPSRSQSLMPWPHRRITARFRVRSLSTLFVFARGCRRIDKFTSTRP